MHIATFPVRLQNLNKSLTIKVPKSLGVTAGVYLQEAARKIPDYNTQINCDANGADKQGTSIRVNTLGRWLFGVPGYQSHVRIVPQGENIVLYFPEQSPELVHTFLYKLKNTIEHQGKN